MKELVALTSVLALGGSLGVAALFAGSAPSFAAARSYATGGDPESVAIGDLNDDGKPDLATANFGRTVSVLLNSGDGSYQAKRNYRIAGAESVAIGDLNGDAKPDLATANGDVDTVSVLLNSGDGSFQAKIDYATGHGSRSVAIGELDGDGRPDLATANYWASTVSVLLNSGDGSFQAKRDYPTRTYPDSVAIGELNGDGAPDLATASYHAHYVSVLLNGGDGSFQAGRDYTTGGIEEGSLSVAIGDLSGDAKPDLAIANRDANTVSVLVNKGNGSFRAKHDYRTGGNPQSVAIGDLNGDAKLDLATANFRGSSTVSVLANSGDGSFRAKLDYATGYGPESVAIGDLNGDRKPDLATANSWANTVSVLLNTPGLCTVQDVFRQKLPAAKRTIARANCRVGKIRRVYSKWRKGLVISEKPRPGTVLPNRGKVNFVVSRGRRPS